MAIFNDFYGLRGQSLSACITFVASCLFVAFGYGQADLGGLITIRSFQERFPLMDYTKVLGVANDGRAAMIQGATVATWNIGCFFAALLAVFIGDSLGRKRTLMIGILILAAGKAIQATSYSYPQYVVGRFIAGFGNGFNTSAAPAWQAECTKAHKRGRMLIVSSGACIALGIALAYWIDFGMSFVPLTSASWRFPMAAQVIFLIPCLILLPKLPESPRWLILKGRQQEALKVLSALNDVKPNHPDIRAEFLQIKDAILQMASGSTKQAFKMGEYRYAHRIILAVMLQVMQQWTGINLFIQYLGFMFVGQANVLGWKGRILAASAATEFFLISFVAVIGIDRFWGRRTLTMFGSSGMCASFIVLAIMLYFNTIATRTVLIVMIFVTIGFFGIGWQGMSWLWAVELVPLPVRGPANALATSANWLSNFAVVLIVPYCFEMIGWKTYIPFAAINFVIVPIIYFFYPETGCRSLEEVDVLFHLASQSRRPWLSVRDVALTEPLWYGKNGQSPFSYEQSEWHQRFARLSSDEGDALSGSGDEKNGSGSGDDKTGSGSDGLADGLLKQQERGRTMERHNGQWL